MLLHCCRGWAYPCCKNTPIMREHKRAVRQIKGRWKLTTKSFSLFPYLIESLLLYFVSGSEEFLQKEVRQPLAVVAQNRMLFNEVIEDNAAAKIL